MVAIFVALTFVGLVLTDLVLEKWRAHQAVRRTLATSVNLRWPELDAWCQLPAGVHLSPAHAWFKPDPTGGLEVGADALIAHAIGIARRVVLPKVGDQVTVGQPLFRLEDNDRGIMVPSAVTGRVLAVNSRLADHPELLSSDPYGRGWVCYLSPPQRGEHTTALHFGEKAILWLKNEFVRFREFIAAQAVPDFALGLTSQDGGLPAVGCLAELAPTAWRAFEAEFLRHA
jgi:glycine cleavage system H protein